LEVEKDLLKLYLALLLAVGCYSCREGIIEPDNFAGNINEPIQINKLNTFTFLLNASSFNMELSVPASFNSNTARISITLIDYTKGYINISVKDFEDRERYRHFVAEDVELYTDLLDGYILKRIEIRAQNFSGKIKLQLTRVF
jgi:hypothetical protein